MTLVYGKDALLRESKIAAEGADRELKHAEHAWAQRRHLSAGEDAATVAAMTSIAHSARELCCLARVVVEHLTGEGK